MKWIISYQIKVIMHYIVGAIDSKRYFYSIRKPTHLGQKLKDNAGTEYRNFYNILYNLRNNYERDNNNIVIYNMDETPICFEMVANSTVVKIGSRNVTIRSFGSDGARITIILCIDLMEKKFHL